MRACFGFRREPERVPCPWPTPPTTPIAGGSGSRVDRWRRRGSTPSPWSWAGALRTERRSRRRIGAEKSLWEHVAVVVKTNWIPFLGVGAPPILVYLSGGSKPFWDPILVGEFTTHFRTYFSGWIGMFTGGTIWILTHGHLALEALALGEQHRTSAPSAATWSPCAEKFWVGVHRSLFFPSPALCSSPASVRDKEQSCKGH